LGGRAGEQDHPKRRQVVPLARLDPKLLHGTHIGGAGAEHRRTGLGRQAPENVRFGRRRATIIGTMLPPQSSALTSVLNIIQPVMV
jgi:hypothetical protein